MCTGGWLDLVIQPAHAIPSQLNFQIAGIDRSEIGVLYNIVEQSLLSPLLYM
jgi:hypothetical protein